MSALDEIRGRLETANAEMDRLTAGYPGTDWRWSIPADPKRDSDLILAASLGDNTRLLAAVEGVLGLHREELSFAPEGTVQDCHECELPYPCPTVQAITAALEGVR